MPKNGKTVQPDTKKTRGSSRSNPNPGKPARDAVDVQPRRTGKRETGFKTSPVRPPEPVAPKPAPVVEVGCRLCRGYARELGVPASQLHAEVCCVRQPPSQAYFSLAPHEIQEREVEAALLYRMHGFKPRPGADGVKAVVVGKTATGSEITAKTSQVGEGGGKRHRIQIFGFSHTAIVMWMGGKGFKLEDVKKAFSSMGLPEVSEASIKTFLRCGANPEARVREKRGDVPNLNEQQGEELLQAAGKAAPKTVEKSIKPKTRKGGAS